MGTDTVLRSAMVMAGTVGLVAVVVVQILRGVTARSSGLEKTVSAVNDLIPPRKIGHPLRTARGILQRKLFSRPGR